MVRTAFAAVPLLLLAACGSTPPQQPAPSTTSSSPATTSSTTPTTSSATTSSTTSSTTTSHPFEAADGRNLKACSDGTCEVIAKNGSVISLKGAGTLTINVEGESVSFGIGGGSFYGSLTGSGTISDPKAGTYSFESLGVRGNEALIRITKE